MCTLTYISQASGFILTNSRDEDPRRPTLLPKWHVKKEKHFLAPIDDVSGGTWIAATDNRFCCLLNGAFAAHEKKERYRKSRGLVLMEALLAEESFYCLKSMNLADIEPFTLVCINAEKSLEIHEWVWDGEKKHHWKLDESKPYIWSSATLYAPTAKAIRKNWFEEFLKINQSPTDDEIRAFHLMKHHQDNSININMFREGVQSLSLSQINYLEKAWQMHYHDLLTNKTQQFQLEKIQI